MLIFPLFFQVKKKKTKQFKGEISFSEICVRGKRLLCKAFCPYSPIIICASTSKLISCHYGNFTSSVETHLEMATYLTEGLLLQLNGFQADLFTFDRVRHYTPYTTPRQWRNTLGGLVKKTKGKPWVINNRHVKMSAVLCWHVLDDPARSLLKFILHTSALF